VQKKGNNPFKQHQERKVSENEAKVRIAISDAEKNKLTISYPLISKVTGIPYQTLKSRGSAGKRYRVLIDAAVFRSRKWNAEAVLPAKTPKTLEEAKAYISVLSYQLDSERQKTKEMGEIIKNPESLLGALGFKKGGSPKVPELSLARDFCDLIDKLFETCHLDFDENNNIIGRGLSHDIRASYELTKVYLDWREKV
jgi:hypothetical protein